MDKVDIFDPCVVTNTSRQDAMIDQAFKCLRNIDYAVRESPAAPNLGNLELCIFKNLQGIHDNVMGAVAAIKSDKFGADMGVPKADA